MDLSLDFLEDKTPKFFQFQSQLFQLFKNKKQEMSVKNICKPNERQVVVLFRDGDNSVKKLNAVFIFLCYETWGYLQNNTLIQ